MPELPEVETVMRGLFPVMVNASLSHIEQRRADLRFPFPAKFVHRLKGRKVLNLERRAKYILVSLEGGETLVMHLGMSGRFSIDGVGPGADDKHCHVVFHLSGGGVVRYSDPRRFGYMDLIETGRLEQHKYFANLGPEPLGNGFHGPYLAAKAFGRKGAIKNFLLDQRVVAGLGNIYVLEALHRVGLSPLKSASVLVTKGGRTRPVADELVGAVRDVLKTAISAGGSSLRDYAKADGELGYFQHQFQVYGRDGAACLKPGCDGVVQRIVQSGRSSFYCPCCQR